MEAVRVLVCSDTWEEVLPFDDGLSLRNGLGISKEFLSVSTK